MDTKLSVKEIELMLYKSNLFKSSDCIVVPNLSYGLLNHEADLVVVTKNGILTEIEIKRSFQDLKKDFEKGTFHIDDRVSRFYYCIPEKILDKALNLFMEQKEKIKELYGYDMYISPGLIVYNDEGHICVKNDRSSRLKSRKIFLEEREKLARLMSLRYWSLVEKTINKEKESKVKDEGESCS